MTKVIKDSILYNNLTSADKASKVASRLAKSLSENLVDKGQLINELSIIERRINQPTKFLTLDALHSGRILLINDDQAVLPSFIPPLVFKSGSGVKAVINLNKYSNSKSPVTNPSVLFGLLQNAFIGIKLYENWDRFKNNDALAKYSAIAYSNMMIKVLDKLYSVNLNAEESDFVAFIFAKFFMIHVMDRKNSEEVDLLASDVLIRGTDLRVVKEKEDMFDTVLLYKDIVSLFNTLNSSPRHKIKLRAFVENFARMYGESSILAIDYFPAFLQTIYSAAAVSTLNKDFIILNVAGNKNIMKSLSAFSNLL